MDNEFNETDYYDYYDQESNNQESNNQECGIFDEDNVDLYEDTMFDEMDEFGESDDFDNVSYDNRFWCKSFVTNMENCDKRLIDKAIVDSRLSGIIYIEDVAYLSSGKIEYKMFSLHTKEVGIDLTDFWNEFESLKIHETKSIKKYYNSI